MEYEKVLKESQEICYYDCLYVAQIHDPIQEELERQRYEENLPRTQIKKILDSQEEFKRETLEKISRLEANIHSSISTFESSFSSFESSITKNNQKIQEEIQNKLLSLETSLKIIENQTKREQEKPESKDNQGISQMEGSRRLQTKVSKSKTGFD